MVNYALLALPLYTILTIAPHTYAVILSLRSTPLQNANPHGKAYLSALERTLPPKTYARYERAEAAHRNSVESAPLFVGTLLASVVAETVSGRNVGATSFAAGWLGLRAVYTLLYINTEAEEYSKARSLTWVATLLWAFWQVGVCAVALG